MSDLVGNPEDRFSRVEDFKPIQSLTCVKRRYSTVMQRLSKTSVFGVGITF